MWPKVKRLLSSGTFTLLARLLKDFEKVGNLMFAPCFVVTSCVHDRLFHTREVWPCCCIVSGSNDRQSRHSWSMETWCWMTLPRLHGSKATSTATPMSVNQAKRSICVSALDSERVASPAALGCPAVTDIGRHCCVTGCTSGASPTANQCEAHRRRAPGAARAFSPCIVR